MPDQLRMPMSDNARAGYRLHHLEVLNWGTFDEHIYAMDVAGGTTLLTGANGSGKSTLVDALLTLLVPNRRRNYNKAGAGRKRERSEKTYVQGAYSTTRSADSYAAKTQYLRTGDSYSVLLAHFYNADSEDHVTLAQVLWMQEGRTRKFFTVARTRLSIEQHFTAFSGIRELKKRLRSQEGVELFRQFNTYSRRFHKLFGLRSSKAFDLFNQMVAIKEVGNLNRFVRTHMLEEQDVQERIDQLRENFENLTRAHEAIRKAREQRDRLRPIVEEAEAYEKLRIEVAALDACARLVPAYTARRKEALLQEAIAETEQACRQAENRRDGCDRQIGELDEQRISLKADLRNDEVGRQIDRLGERIERLHAGAARKKERAQRYAEVADSLGFSSELDEAAFYDARNRAREQQQKLEGQQETLNEGRTANSISEQEAEREVARLEKRLRSLRTQKGRIPEAQLVLRRRLQDALGLRTAEAPFVGEIVKVREAERDWEGAIERALRPFALSLLVPEKHAASVSRHVHEHTLNARLAYYVVPEREPAFERPDLAGNSLPGKLALKPGAPYAGWLERALIRRFDLVCCEEMAHFGEEHDALMKDGLLKQAGLRHEKDDRRRLDDPAQYVLGWENEDTRQALRRALEKQQETLQAARGKLDSIRAAQQQLNRKREQLQRLLGFEAFEELNWKRDAVEAQRLADEKERLEASADKLRQLEADLRAVNERIESVKEERGEAQQRLVESRHALAQYEKQRRRCRKRLRRASGEELDQHAPRIERRLGDTRFTLETAGGLEEELQTHFADQAGRKKDDLRRLEKRIEKMMLRYKNDYEAETTHVDDAIEAVDQYVQLLKQIEQDDLPRYEKQFKELLDEKVVTNVVGFKNGLETRVEDIKRRIDELNESLKAIDYTPSTYIRLEYAANRDAEILDFKNQLKACIPDWSQMQSTAAANEASYQRVRALIERFDDADQKRWTDKVTDVRNWLDFAVSERYRADDAEKQHYSDSSGASGGQKAKLAYTILASAVAYQFGLHGEADPASSFRFVVVDEAFSKSDEVNARYAMDLFHKMQLQLMVVTPLSDIHIVEPYIASCQFVKNNAEGSSSKVYTLTWEDYAEKKEAFRQAAEQRGNGREGEGERERIEDSGNVNLSQAATDN